MMIRTKKDMKRNYLYKLSQLVLMATFILGMTGCNETLDSLFSEDISEGEEVMFTTSLPSAKAEVLLAEETRQQQKNILRQINLAKGRYKKQASEKLKASIADLYGQLTAPSDALSSELKELGII